MSIGASVDHVYDDDKNMRRNRSRSLSRLQAATN